MRVYIAGKWEAKARLVGIASKLEALGHTVTSRWLKNDVAVETGAWALMTGNEASGIAQQDLLDIDAADALILDTIDESNTGGREVEYGFALGRGKIVMVIGPKRNGFHHLFEGFQGWDEFLTKLGG